MAKNGYIIPLKTRPTASARGMYPIALNAYQAFKYFFVLLI